MLSRINNKLWSFLYRLASPKSFYNFSLSIQPWLAILMIILMSYGAIGGLWLSPADYQQGDAFRIIYVHVPCAFMSMGIYTMMSLTAAIGLIWRIKISHVIMRASAPIGAWFTFAALVTGAIWGKPMWGTWWIWDARLTSELILLFLYIGFIALQSAIPDRHQANKAGAILVLVGFIDIPIIHYSVLWWQTLHQGPTLSKLAMPSISASMLYPLLAMITAFFIGYFLMVMMRSRNELLLIERQSSWVKALINERVG